MRILAVEDNEDSRKLLVKVLHAYGHEVIAATNGVEALEQALAQPPDIIVSDIMMPKMDGFQLCQVCKQNDKLKGIPFVFYTATYLSGEDRKFALSLGADAFIRKPAEPDVIVQTLCEVFEKSKAGALAPAKAAPLEPSLFFTKYSKRIVAKLEEKVAELEGEITKRRQAEEALKESEKNLKAYLESAPDGIYVNDLKGTFLYGNTKTEALMGYKREELIGKSFLKLKLLPAKYVAKAAKLLVLNAMGRPTGPDEFELTRKDGSRIWVEIGTTPIKQKGKVVVIGIVRDITERKNAEEKLQQSYQKLKRVLDETTNSMAAAIESRDVYTAGHQRRVTRLSRAIAEGIGLSDEQIDSLCTAALIHDIGKIQVPTDILNKPGRLTEIEFSLIKEHPKVGYEILKSIEFNGPVAEIIFQHHERLDGSGYPQGLSDGGILLEAKILAVADVVEAMASHRPYRPALGIKAAIGEITKNKGILYDADIVGACNKLITEKKFKFE